jgi:hypothetical protein
MPPVAAGAAPSRARNSMIIQNGPAGPENRECKIKLSGNSLPRVALAVEAGEETTEGPGVLAR